MKTILDFHGIWIRGNEKAFLSFANSLVSCNVGRALVPHWEMQKSMPGFEDDLKSPDLLSPNSRLAMTEQRWESAAPDYNFLWSDQCRCPSDLTGAGQYTPRPPTMLLSSRSWCFSNAFEYAMQSRWLAELAALLSLAGWSHPLPTCERHLRRALWSLMVLELLCAIQLRIREYIFIWDFLPLLAEEPVWRFVTLLAFAGDRCWRVSLTLSLWTWVTQWPVHQQSSLCTWCVFSSVESVEEMLPEFNKGVYHVQLLFVVQLRSKSLSKFNTD